MGLSRLGGFSFCGKSIANLDFDLNTYKLISVDRPITPTMTYREFVVPNRNGSSRYDNRYEDKPITVVVGVRGTAIERQQKIVSLLQDWIGVEGKLMFDDRPLLFYNAKFYDSVVSGEGDTFTEVTISFIASYVMYELYDDLRDYTVNELTMALDDMGMLLNRATWNAITTSQIKQIENTGNFESQPIIELTGSATLLTMQIADKAFSFNSLASESVFIDTEKMIVYKIVNNKKVSAMTRHSGLFQTIPTGYSDVIIGGTSLNLDITAHFKNTYIC